MPDFAFFLVSMQSIDPTRQTNGIDGAIHIAAVVLHDLEHAGTTEAAEWFGVGMFPTLLSDK